MGRLAGHDDADGQDALGLDADVHVGRLARDGEVRAVAATHERVGGALLDLLGLLVRRTQKADAHGVLFGRLAHGAHHGRQPALHVVGAAADQPVALDARVELSLERRNDIEVPVQHDGRRILRPHVCHHHRQTVELAVDHRDLA